MRRYKFFYYVTYLIVWIVTGAILFFIGYPIWNFYHKESSPVRIADSGNLQEKSAFQWIKRFQKIDPDIENPDQSEIIIFNDRDDFNSARIQNLFGKIGIINALYYQISDSDDNLERINYLTNINYSGYYGSVFQKLNDRKSIPEKLIALYEENTGLPWNFYGEGIIITNNQQVLVLQKGTDYQGSILLKMNDLKINFYGIFEITSSNETSRGTFSIDLLPNGKKMFSEAGIPSEFPASYEIRRNAYEIYYFAGNFSSFQIKVPFQYDLITKLMQHKIFYSKYQNEEVFWRWYYPFIDQIISSTGAKIKSDEKLIPRYPMEKNHVFSAAGQEIYITSKTTKSKFFIKGVNIGPALPGKFFTEFPEDKNVYLKWFQQISDLNLNTIRVYTLLPPAFYQALYQFNWNNPMPLFLLQEIWPEEHPVNSDYLNQEYNRTYHQEIEYTVGAIHGNIQIPERQFRSYGFYTYDVSPYLIGYLVGREMEPNEVIETDRLNAGYQFQGNYFYTRAETTPTEAWLAASCDYAAMLEDTLYQNHPLLAIVSWPTLDPMSHDTEWNEAGDKMLQNNDKAVVDINHIGVHEENVAGFFGAYHIYPNYPDFMNNEPAYANYMDAQGSFRYGGYLQEFMQQHTSYPAVVAEYGISTSSATAHFNPDGYHHGGLTEKEQAEGIIRMTEAIVNEGYSGAIIFEWMDEWAKKTWTTEFYMIPYERHVLWHNVLDPEQNYGLLSFDAAESVMETIYSGRTDQNAEQIVRMGQNETYLEIELEGFSKNDSDEIASIAINTFPKERPVWQYLLKLSGNPELLVNPGYQWLNGNYLASPHPFSEYKQMIQLTNSQNISKQGKITSEKTQNLSSLKTGPFINNENQIFIDEKRIRIRIPYGLLGISDPSSRQILLDGKRFIPTSSDQIATQEVDAITVRIIRPNKPDIITEYPLKNWEIPKYTERLKDSFQPLSEYFGTL